MIRHRWCELNSKVAQIQVTSRRHLWRDDRCCFVACVVLSCRASVLTRRTVSNLRDTLISSYPRANDFQLWFLTLTRRVYRCKTSSRFRPSRPLHLSQTRHRQTVLRFTTVRRLELFLRRDSESLFPYVSRFSSTRTWLICVTRA